MQRWEYTTLAFVPGGSDTYVELNGQRRKDWDGRGLELLRALGMEGWEAIGVGGSGATSSWHVVLKRAKAGAA
jgi:hypothetical protein